MSQLLTCQTCEKTYNKEDSTATIVETTDSQSNKLVVDHRLLFCSESCQLIDEEWLENGAAQLAQAKLENPNLFARTNMTREQEQAMDSLTRMGVKFSREDKSSQDLQASER